MATSQTLFSARMRCMEGPRPSRSRSAPADGRNGLPDDRCTAPNGPAGGSAACTAQAVQLCSGWAGAAQWWRAETGALRAGRRGRALAHAGEEVAAGRHRVAAGGDRRELAQGGGLEARVGPALRGGAGGEHGRRVHAGLGRELRGVPAGALLDDEAAAAPPRRVPAVHAGRGDAVRGGADAERRQGAAARARAERPRDGGPQGGAPPHRGAPAGGRVPPPACSPFPR